MSTRSCHRAFALLALAGSLSAPTAAQAPPASLQPPVAAASKPSDPKLSDRKLADNVTCIYDAMSIQQRGNAEALLLEVVTNGGDPFAYRASDPELLAVFNEAHEACLERFSWSMGRTEASQSYALLTILLNALRPLFEADGIKLREIDAYFEANKASLVTAPPSAAKEAALTKHLTAKGWSFENGQIRSGTRLYFFMIIGSEAARRQFAKNSSYGK